MYFNDFSLNRVTITQASNGFVVETQESHGQLYPLGDEDQLRDAARILKDELQGDPLLKTLMDQQPDASPGPRNLRPVRKSPPPLHVFANLKEVYAFLTLQFDNEL